MRIFLMLMCWSVLLVIDLSAQIADTTKVKKPGKKFTATEQQLKAQSYFDKGYALTGNDEFKEAIKPLLKAIEIDSTGNCGTGVDGSAHGELALAYFRLDDFNTSLIYFDQAIEINRLVAEPYLRKSWALMKQGKNDIAIETLNSLVKIIPDCEMAYVQRGFLLSSAKNYELALQDYQHYLEIVQEKNVQQTGGLVKVVKKRIKELEEKIK